MKIIDSQKGQVILVVVLCAVVALTVSLSIASRMVTSLKISKHNEESQRAFQAAEAGVAKALKSVSPDLPSFTLADTTLSNDAKFSARYDLQKSNDLNLNGGNEVDQNKGIDLWLSNYPDYSNPFNGEVTIYWGDVSQRSVCDSTGDNTLPALEIILLSNNVNNPKVEKYFFDYCATNRGNSASSPSFIGWGGYEIAPQSYNFSTESIGSIRVQGGLIMRIIPIYNNAKIGVKSRPLGNDVLPDQGTLVTSTGYYGETQRKITYFESHPQIPAELFYSIMAQNK